MDTPITTMLSGAMRRLHWAHTTTLVLIAVLVGGVFLLRGLGEESRTHDAAVLDLAARQRTLSQRVGLASLKVSEALARGDSTSARAAAARLDSDLLDLLTVHRRLHGADLHVQCTNTEALAAVLERAQPMMELIERDTRALVGIGRGESTSSELDASAHARRVVMLTDALLLWTLDVTALYEDTSSARAQRVEGVTTLVASVLVGGVVGLVLAVVLPARRSLRRAIEADRIRSEEFTRLAEFARLAEIARRTSNAVIVTDALRRIEWVNDAFTRITGYTLDEVRGRTPGSLLQFEGTDQDTVARVREAVAAGREVRAELLNRSKDGREYWIDMHIEPRVDDSGVVTGFMAVESDITERVRLRRELERQASLSRTVQDSLGAHIAVLDRHGGIVDVNTAWNQFACVNGGHAERVGVGMNYLDVVRQAMCATGDASLGDVARAIEDVLAGRKKEYRHTYPCHGPDAKRWFTMRVVPLVGGEGGAVVTHENVTPMVRLTHRLRRSKRDAERALRDVTALRTALDEHALVSIADRTGRIVYANTAFCRISGFSREELIGQDHRILNSGHHPKSFWVDMWRMIARGQAWRGEVCNRRKDGSLYWVDSTIVPCAGADGKVEQYVSIRFDISAQKEAESRLTAAEARAQAASAAKSEFLANMSHEIRTPMMAIMGFTELLASEGDRSAAPPARLQHIETIRRNGEHLLSIINDILDVSKIEAGQMRVESTETRPAQIVHDVISLMQVKARERGLALAAAFDSPVPEVIHSDPLRLRQILLNLVGNAIKFTPSGSVTLRVACEGRSMRFDVVDTGIGLSPAQLDRLFQAFTQADASTTRKFGGTGLGLRISKCLASMLGGDITVRSEPGRGSTFRVTVATGPLEGVEMIRPERAAVVVEDVPKAGSLGPAGMLQGARILLAEDGPDNQRLISHHLRKAGAEVTIVENGRLAVEALTVDGTLGGDLAMPAKFDMLLTDMQMPELDGYAATRLLRAKGCTMPILALTAHAMAGDEAKCIAAGCDAYASKPIDRVKLIESCRRVLSAPELRRAA